MMARHARRLDRLEETSGQTDEYLQPTDDELNVQLLSILLSIEERRKVFRFFCPVCALSENQTRIDAIMGDIISTAAAQRRPDYQQHLEWCRKMWAKQDKGMPYVPALTGGTFGELQDWDAPNVMQRRAELRASRLVQEVLKRRLH
jgi:hypothetical protein